MIIVGTPPVKLTRSDSARASIRAGSNPGMSTRVPRRPERAEHRDHAAAGVEQGHRSQEGRGVGHPDALGPQGGVVHHAHVMQHGSLREAGCAAGVLDLHGVVRSDLRQRLDAGCGRGELTELVESQHLAQLGKIGADRLDVGGEWVAPHLGHDEHTDRLRLAEHVRDLGRLKRRVHSDEREAGERGAVLQHDPFGKVVRPDADVLTRLEPCEQRGRTLLGVAQQLGVGPPSAGGSVGQTLDKCDAIGHLSGHLSERAPHRDVRTEWRATVVGDPMRGGQRSRHARTVPRRLITVTES